MTADAHCNLLFANQQRAPVQRHGKALNRGADGAIYRSACGRFALKYFHEPDKNPQRRHKLWQMMQHAPEDSSASHFAWPQALLLGRKGQLLGFAMPLLDIRSHVSLDAVLTRRGRELERLPQGCAWRLQVAINLSKRVAELHERGHSIIDLKPANLLVHRTTGDVSVVDCDGFAVQGSEDCYPAHQFTAGYIAPEAWRAARKPEELSQPQDTFALAVILFGLLDNGLHPFQGIPTTGHEVPSDNQNRIAGGFYPYGIQPHPAISPSPWSVHHGLPRILREAFDRSLTSTQRVTAREWAELLQQAATRMQQCRSNAEHGYWSKQCPYCLSAVRPRKMPSSSAAPTPTADPPSMPGPASTTTTPGTSSQPSSASGGSWLTPIILIAGVVLVFKMTFVLLDMLGSLLSGLASLVALVFPPSVIVEPPIPVAPPAPSVQELRLATARGFNGAAPLAPRQQWQDSNLPVRLFDEGSALLPYLSALQADGTPLLLSAPGSNDNPLRLARAPQVMQPAAASGELIAAPFSLQPRFASPRQYGAYWQADPRPATQGIYLPSCKYRLCLPLQYLSPGGSRTFALPEWEADLSGLRISPWRYRISPEGNYVVIASSSQLLIQSAEGHRAAAGEGWMKLELPAAWRELQPTSLAVAANAESLVLGLTDINSREHTTVLLQVLRSGSTLTLDSSFNAQAEQAGVSKAGAWVSLSADGKTLATSDWGSPGANTPSPGISIWQRQQAGRWQLKQRLSAQDLGITEDSAWTDQQLSQWHDRSGPTYQGQQSPHYGFQLSANGGHLLSGLQVSDAHPDYRASARLFLLKRDNTSHCIGWISSRFTRTPFSGKVRPDLSMSADGRHAALGWFHFFQTAHEPGMRQNYQIALYDLPGSLDKAAGCPALTGTEQPAQ